MFCWHVHKYRHADQMRMHHEVCLTHANIEACVHRSSAIHIRTLILYEIMLHLLGVAIIYGRTPRRKPCDSETESWWFQNVYVRWRIVQGYQVPYHEETVKTGLRVTSGKP